MKKSIAPIHVGNGIREQRTLVVFESMGEVIDFIYSFNDGKLPPIYYSGTEYGNMDVESNFWLRMCVNDIRLGDPHINREISERAEKWKHMLLEIEPRFALKYHWSTTEQSAVFDPGKIAADEENPCYNRIRPTDEIQPGRGGGAYRIVINTDIPWWSSRIDGAAAMGAIVLILQEIAPVEVFIQQGWMGPHVTDGVTLFPVITDGPLNPINLAFWCGHEYKDIPFSLIVNRLLGRKNIHISVLPEIDCNLYFAGFRWPQVEPYDQHSSEKLPDEVKVNYIADILKKTLFVENLSGWKIDYGGMGELEVA